MKRQLLIFILTVLFSAAWAQEKSADTGNAKYAFSFSPQYLIVGGMRLNFDQAISDKLWLTLAPTFYYMDNSYMWEPESTSFVGVGAAANLRYFPTGKGVYALCGLNYRFLDADYVKYGQTEENEAKFNTSGFDVAFGYQFFLVEQLFMDMYLGWGFRYSTQATVEEDVYWSDMILDLAYSGFLPVAGVRIGFGF